MFQMIHHLEALLFPRAENPPNNAPLAIPTQNPREKTHFHPVHAGWSLLVNSAWYGRHFV
ncbi:hypothetical protein NQ317_007454 [Molorchus minor]|uniref:Uncharacterized protein n=1 Tax=Molorchus minor TaxID=1323400 RepID=A0ABQ9JE38_9CUCU|nr:hypothetical protein NQ317_007454 [Molorchus minor]